MRARRLVDALDVAGRSAGVGDGGRGTGGGGVVVVFFVHEVGGRFGVLGVETRRRCGVASVALEIAFALLGHRLVVCAVVVATTATTDDNDDDNDREQHANADADADAERSSDRIESERSMALVDRTRPGEEQSRLPQTDPIPTHGVLRSTRKESR